MCCVIIHRAQPHMWVLYICVCECTGVYCYVRESWLISAILLKFSRGTASHILLFILCALQYTMLIFRFPSLHSLRQYELIMWLIDITINLYYFTIFQYHNNNTTNINNITVHLTVIVSLRVPPLQACDLSNLDVILLQFVNLVSDHFLPDSPLNLSLSNLTTASLFLYNLGRYYKIRKLSGSHNFITHNSKIRAKC